MSGYAAVGENVKLRLQQSYLEKKIVEFSADTLAFKTIALRLRRKSRVNIKPIADKTIGAPS